MDEQTVNQNDEVLNKIISERDEYLAGWQRAKADFVNREKEVAREREYLNTVTKASIVKKFLPLVDTLEQTVRTIHASESNLKMGAEAMLKQSLDILRELGVKKIEAVGQPFNPEWHEVVLTEASEEAEDLVIKEVQSGYALDDRVLRAAQVIISKHVA